MMHDDAEGLNDSPRGPHGGIRRIMDQNAIPPVYGAAYNNALLHNNGYGNNNIVVVAPAGNMVDGYGGNYNYNNANNAGNAQNAYGQNGGNIHNGQFQRGVNGEQLRNDQYGIMVVPMYTPDRKERRQTVIKTNEFEDYRCCFVCKISSALSLISVYRIFMAVCYGILAGDLYISPSSMDQSLQKPIYYVFFPLYAISGLVVGIYGIHFKNITLSTPDEKYMQKSRTLHRLTLGMIGLIVVEMIAEWIVNSYPNDLSLVDTVVSAYFFYVLKKCFRFKGYQRYLQQQQLQQQLAQQQGR